MLNYFQNTIITPSLIVEEGVIFHMLQNAKRILGDENGRVNALECLRYELGEPDDSGRRRPVVIEGSEFIIDLDTLSIALRGVIWEDLKRNQKMIQNTS